MNVDQPASLFAAARTFWRSFAPAWLFPFVLLYGGLAAERLGHPGLFFWLFAAPLFFWSYFRASRPWMERRIRYWHGAFWVMLFPFLIWAVAVYSRLAIVHLSGAAHGT